MDINNLTTYDQKELLLLHVLKSNLEIVENTHSKAQETLEFKMNTPIKDFQFDEPLILSDSWMMGVTNLEVYNTVYNIDQTNNTFRLEKEFINTIIKYINKRGKFYINKNDTSKLNEIKRLLQENKDICDYVSYSIVHKIQSDSNAITNSNTTTNTITKTNLDEYEEFDYESIQDCIKKDILNLTKITIPPGVYEFAELSNCINNVLENINETFKINKS